MKKIFILIAILILVSAQSFGQTWKLYGIRINSNGTRDSFFTKSIFFDSVFNNEGTFVTMSVEFGSKIDGYSFPASFANFTKRADGIWQTYLTPLSDASGMTGINSDVTAALSGKLGTSGNGGSLTGLTKTQVGLSNVDNTSDLSKPVSTATQTALNGKENSLGFTPVPNTRTVNGKALNANISVTASDVGLGNVTNESKATMFTSPAFTGTPTGITATHVGLGNVDNTSDATKNAAAANLTNKTIGGFNAALDAGANDSYTITLSPAPAAYTTGMIVIFRANTANTTGCTINVNGLGVKAINKRVNTATATGDILALMWCMLIYDGANFIILNPIVN